MRRRWRLNADAAWKRSDSRCQHVQTQTLQHLHTTSRLAALEGAKLIPRARCLSQTLAMERKTLMYKDPNSRALGGPFQPQCAKKRTQQLYRASSNGCVEKRKKNVAKVTSERPSDVNTDRGVDTQSTAVETVPPMSSLESTGQVHRPALPPSNLVTAQKHPRHLHSR